MTAPRLPRLLFISKPLLPPYRDGTKCLVREICCHVQVAEPSVLGDGLPAAELGNGTRVESVYATAGSYAPSAWDNARAALWVLFRSRAQLWQFVFAPNVTSSLVGRLLKWFRRVPVVQTIASPPKSFEQPARLLFGDIIVAQSEWTRRQFYESYHSLQKTPPRIEVIHPAVSATLQAQSDTAVKEARVEVGAAADAQILLYPGDLEMSQGAARVAQVAEEMLARHPRAHIVFAYRNKTPAAAKCAEELSRALSHERVTVIANVRNIHALVQASSAILFPVDDLYGKVDLPIVLLEALVLGTPVLVSEEGPLAELKGALQVPLHRADAGDQFEPSAWQSAVDWVLSEEGSAEQLRQAQAALPLFSAERMTRSYEGLYRELLAAR